MDLSEWFQMRLGVHSIVSLKLLHHHHLPLRATHWNTTWTSTTSWAPF